MDVCLSRSSVEAAKDTAIVQYYGMRIGNRTQAFEWYYFYRPRVTSNPYFKVTPSLTLNISETVRDRDIVAI